MADREEILRNETFKGTCPDVIERVVRTLANDEASALARTQRLIALLVGRLREEAILNGRELDEILLKCLG
jgi:hypothetical protein